ncbi:hypothetical protein [Streptomyces sp. NBC_01334]|uniref:hypothetical protein n=1 Tax=Streptomyces sp. NBC_01334 TaxID=2903827 RepID=UPI002E157A2C|nr:hypothetical protein OG736_00630 [Streptomyces sp. NBC_01334]
MLVLAALDARLGGYRDGERSLAYQLAGSTGSGDLVIADRGFWSVEFAHNFTATGADLLVRLQPNHLGPGGPTGPAHRKVSGRSCGPTSPVHHAIRRFAHTAALVGPAVDPDRVSYLECVRIIHRSVPSQPGSTTAKLTRFITEAGQEARSRLLPTRRSRN